eukprot:13685107-Alexandrium_andersonii.AAC.1
MSASLVGSEMCIRDRPGPHRRPPGAHPAKTRETRPAGGHQAATRRPPAVSYTHLTLPTICSV